MNVSKVGMSPPRTGMNVPKVGMSLPVIAKFNWALICTTFKASMRFAF
jgi:hypothetical protein